MFKGAIIGFGAVAENAHVPAWGRSPRFSIAAVADAQSARRELAAKLLPGARTYPDLETLLRAERGLDFVDIATPPFLHESQILLALDNDCHVLCEKPLVLEGAQLERIRARAARRKRAVFSVDNWKHAPIFQKLRSLVLSGAVGALRHVELDTLRSRPADAASPWRTDPRLSGGGILMDHGWHAFYLLGWLLEASPSSIRGELEFSPDGRVEEEAACLLRYPRATASVFLTWRAGRRLNRGVLYGEDGMIELADDRLILTRARAPGETFMFPEPLSKGSAHPDWFFAMLADFEAALSDPARAEANLAEARDCLAITDELYRQLKPEAAGAL